jgi:hypothetical protein
MAGKNDSTFYKEYVTYFIFLLQQNLEEFEMSKNQISKIEQKLLCKRAPEKSQIKIWANKKSEQTADSLGISAEEIRKIVKTDKPLKLKDVYMANQIITSVPDSPISRIRDALEV